MAIPYTPDPFTWTPNNAYIWRNVRYATLKTNGVGVDLLCSVYRHPVRMTGGNPVFFGPHGGSHINNSHIEFAETNGGSLPNVGKFLAGYLMQVEDYFADPRYFYDFVSIEPAYFSNGLSASGVATFANGDLKEYYQYHEGTTYRGVQSIRGQLLDPIWSVQKCMQTFARYADDPYSGPFGDMDRSKFFIGPGDSVGGATAIGAGYTRSIPYCSTDARPWAAQHPARAKGVFVFRPEIDWDPWRMANRHVRHNTGMCHTDANVIREHHERFFLKPDASGLYPVGSPKTSIAKALSAVDVIANAPADRGSTRLRAHYWKGFGVGGVFEETLSNVFSYSGIPPYDSAGHDWRQHAILAAACAAKDVARGDGLTMFSGEVLDQANWPDSGGDLGYLNALRDSVRRAYVWACDLCDGIEPTV